VQVTLPQLSPGWHLVPGDSMASKDLAHVCSIEPLAAIEAIRLRSSALMIAKRRLPRNLPPLHPIALIYLEVRFLFV
jgi:hypothetical protein